MSDTSESPAASLGAFVRRSRRAARLNQGELARLAGVGRRFVSELENGKPGLRLEKVDRVLRVFGKGIGLVDLRSRVQEEDEQA